MSNSSVPSILLVEDDPVSAELYEAALRRENYFVVSAATGTEASSCLRQFRPAAMILDLHLPDANGIDILRESRATYPQMPVIVVTGDTSPQAALAAISEGACDFIQKPFSSARLTVTLRNALERVALEREVVEWRQALGQSNCHGFVGQSPAMLAVYRIIDSVAASKASVFITGESGTGKELAAQALHKGSPRRAKPFIAINCGAIPRELLESTLFGHMKGSFTGATADHVGAAKAADGGTLFLDEIGELPLDLQVKLLRFLQTGEIMPVGSNKAESVDVRIIAATNRKPREEVEQGRLREDLFYRLHVVPLEMPPLRERDDDVLLLSEHFLRLFSAEENKHFTALDPEVASLFRRYDWPGNVRQLENVLRAVVVMHEGSVVKPSMLPDSLQSSPLPARKITTTPRETVPIKPLWLVEKEAILQALAYTMQDVSRAAAYLEVSPSTLYRKLQAWKTEKA